jgi:hypothetical protein
VVCRAVIQSLYDRNYINFIRLAELFSDDSANTDVRTTTVPFIIVRLYVIVIDRLRGTAILKHPVIHDVGQISSFRI